MTKILFVLALLIIATLAFVANASDIYYFDKDDQTYEEVMKKFPNENRMPIPNCLDCID